MKCVLLLLILCQLDFDFVKSESDPFEVSEDEDPFTKQTKLLISNDYRELMTIYDPIWLANLWPKLKNGVHLKMEKNCWKNLTQFFQDMLEGHAWALAGKYIQNILYVRLIGVWIKIAIRNVKYHRSTNMP